VTSGPAVEPITVADAKRHCEIPQADAMHDAYLTALIAAAREHYERRTHRALINRTLALTLDKFPATNAPIYLPWAPVSSLTSITYTDTDGTTQTWSSANYALQKNMEPGRVVLAYNCLWPSIRVKAAGITVTYVAGYGAAASSVPQNAIHAVRLLVRHWFENRMPVNIGNIVNELPQAFESLVEAARVPDDFLSYGMDWWAA
jgi:uncharacterized phiE125 gp8 family phage protein